MEKLWCLDMSRKPQRGCINIQKPSIARLILSIWTCLTMIRISTTIIMAYLNLATTAIISTSLPIKGIQADSSFLIRMATMDSSWWMDLGVICSSTMMIYKKQASPNRGSWTSGTQKKWGSNSLASSMMENTRNPKKQSIWSPLSTNTDHTEEPYIYDKKIHRKGSLKG